jgi:anthranilate synthase/aminodeoxychorismate synthase-like glutamine amidotransferase
MILLIDNYDSFTYNLYQYFGELNEEILVVRNDQISISEILELKPEAILLSPGPGRPEHAGICVEIIKSLYQSIPILGICLGHQAIGYAFGSTIKRAETIMHGKTSTLIHDSTSLFSNLPQHIEVMRYHSLVIDQTTLNHQLIPLAFSEDDQELMAIKHKDFPLYGLQFHPESVGTLLGKQLLGNFLSESRKERRHETIS